MSINATSAAGAYAEALQRAAQAPGTGAETAAKSLPGSFGDLLAQQVQGLETSAKAGEAAATQAAAGQGNLVDLVTQVAEAEVMLQTAVTIRDQVISAYQDIMKMPM